VELGLRGKSAIVAAASKGIGRAIAFGLAAEGVRLAICAREPGPLEKTAQEIADVTRSDVLAIPADVSRAEDIRRLVSMAAMAFGDLHILVNNVGGPPPGSFDEPTDAEWQGAIDLNLMSTVRLSRDVIPRMRRAGGGRIINVMSMSMREPVNGLILSDAVRGAVIGLAKTMANELARDRITVNTVCPGWILTDRFRALTKSPAANEGRSLEDFMKMQEAEIPLGRYGRPEEVVHLVVFLASEAAGYITGTTIQVDGGLMTGLM
jgi:3-oxoacyl-[acyl-carrier protein] reductase